MFNLDNTSKGYIEKNPTIDKIYKKKCFTPLNMVWKDSLHLKFCSQLLITNAASLYTNINVEY